MPHTISRFELTCKAHLAVALFNLFFAFVFLLPLQLILGLMLDSTPAWRDTLLIAFLMVSLFIYSPWQRLIKVAMLDKNGKILTIVGPTPTSDQIKRPPKD
jgi:hypothetical protein